MKAKELERMRKAKKNVWWQSDVDALLAHIDAIQKRLTDAEELGYFNNNHLQPRDDQEGAMIDGSLGIIIARMDGYWLGPKEYVYALEAENASLREVAEMVLALADTWTPKELIDAARDALG